ncbi:hypothetical protein V6Z12_D01G171700 [Gossypium hirsutum]
MIIPLPFSPELCNSSQFASLAQSMSSVHSVYPGMLPTRMKADKTQLWISDQENITCPSAFLAIAPEADRKLRPS